MAEGEIAGWVTFSMKPLPSVIQMWSASNKDLMDSITLSPPWHEAAELTEQKVRCERKADIDFISKMTFCG
jgi:hypothetical protein